MIDHHTLRRTAAYTAEPAATGLGTFKHFDGRRVVVAGAGCNVAKHGNLALSILCGHADVPRKLWRSVTLEPDAVARAIRQVGHRISVRRSPCRDQARATVRLGP